MSLIEGLSDNNKWIAGKLKYPFDNGINFQLEINDIDKIYNNFKNSNCAITFDVGENKNFVCKHKKIS